jgi:hypothetical protein
MTTSHDDKFGLVSNASRSIAFLALLTVAARAQQAETGTQNNPQPQLPNLSQSLERARGDEERNAQIDAEVTDVTSFVKWAQVARHDRVEQLYKRREAIRAERGNSRFKRDRIEATNAEIVRINSPTFPYVPRITANKVITLGEPSPTRHLRVLEVIDGQTARLRFSDTSVGGKDLEFFLIGTDTAGWVDGAKPPLTGVLIADGTRSIRTSEGTNRTIAVMKHYAIPNDQLTRREEIRDWTLEGGQLHSGALVLYEAGRVTIMDMDGNATNLKFTELSDTDREYVAKFAPTPAPRKRPPAPKAASGE